MLGSTDYVLFPIYFKVFMLYLRLFLNHVHQYSDPYQYQIDSSFIAVILSTLRGKYQNKLIMMERE
jgi:hypothetical protein